MTRDQLIELISGILWMSGIGSKVGARMAAKNIVERLEREGVLSVKE